MTPRASCLLYTRDSDLLRRVRAYLRPIAQIRHVEDVDRFVAGLQQAGPTVLILDLRTKESHELLEQVKKEWPHVVIVALGAARSEPLRDAEESGVYAAEDIDIDRRHFQALLGRAFDYLKVLEENRDLREESTLVPAPGAMRRMETSSDRYGPPPIPSMRLPRVLRHFNNVDAFLENLVEGIAEAAGVNRVGIFAKIRQGDDYRLRAGLRCLPETSDLEFTERDALVRWLELNAYLINRANLPNVADRAERSMLRHTLDSFGAEVIVPLHARGRTMGWLFFGHRFTGQPFDNSDLERLTILAEQVSTTLENALLYEEGNLQKTLAETLLKAIPPGIIAADEKGIVRCFTPTAEQILGLAGAKILNKPVENLGPVLAGFLRQTIETGTNLAPRNLADHKTRRSLLVEIRGLTGASGPRGAVAVLHDLTVEESLREKQDLVDRAVFWTDLAASMSHEVRNPLVAIKTFAQLLPERFDDKDFRSEFSNIVVKEIDRLDKIITQINNFAHPPELVLKPIDIRAPVRKALEVARHRPEGNGHVRVETSLPDDLPRVLGDEIALTEAFAHLVTNATEAVAGREKPHVTLSAQAIREGKRTSGVLVTVRDNGEGIPPELREKIFSPFCTSKPRGMGLGLPIVKRTVFDHNGRVDIDSNSGGTLVSVILPASSNGH